MAFKKLKPKSEMDKLVGLVKYHQHLYYILDKPEISDAEFDGLYQALLKLEAEQPENVRPDSPTQTVGYVTTNTPFSPVEHFKPLLSLGNVFNEDELKQFIGTLPTDSYVALEMKLDGLAVALTYCNRQLVRAATRGDGVTGEDITANILTINSVPRRLNGYFPKEEFEVHGEVTLPLSALKDINDGLIAQGKKPFANARNAAAGSLRQKDPEKTRQRKLRFNPYGCDQRLIDLYKPATYEELIGLLSTNFDTRATMTKLVASDCMEDIQTWYLEAQEMRSKLDYDIDGVVIKVNEFIHREELGERNREPRWATAYKFPAGTAITTLEAVDWQVGRTGVLTPVARLKPVALMGVTVSNCTLHNLDEIARLDLCLGDTVTISRQGDVIPKVTHVFTELRPRLQQTVVAPKACPSCGQPTVMNPPFLLCGNKECISIRIAKAVYLVSRDCLDIDGLGEQITAELVELDLFKYSIFDIFDLPQLSTCLEVAGVGDKVRAKIIHEVDQRRVMRLDRLIASLGIPGVAGTTAKIIANHFRTFENFKQSLIVGCREPSEFYDIGNLDGIGPITADAWAKGLLEIHDTESNLNLAKNILTAEHSGLIRISSMPEIKSDLAGKTYVITGSFAMNRNHIKELLQQKGAKVSGSISPQTTALIAGENGGSKLSKAESLGIPVLNEQQLKDLLQ